MTRHGALFYGKRDGYCWYKHRIFIFELEILKMIFI